MHLIQILLPLHDNNGAAFGPDLYRDVREELSSRYGGLTAFTRAPAEGHWEDDGKTTRDDIVVFVGGVIPRQDYAFLYEAGVKGIYGPGTPIPASAKDVLEQIRLSVSGR